MRDARTLSQTPPYGPVGTFNGFKLDAPLLERIDYVLLSPQLFRVVGHLPANAAAR